MNQVSSRLAILHSQLWESFTGVDARWAICRKGASHSRCHLQRKSHICLWTLQREEPHRTGQPDWETVLHCHWDHLPLWKTFDSHSLCCWKLPKETLGNHLLFRHDTEGWILDRLGLLRVMFSGEEERWLVTCQTAVAKAGWWPGGGEPIGFPVITYTNNK